MKMKLVAVLLASALASALGVTPSFAAPGVRTHLELMNSFLALTGTPMSPAIRAVYNSSKSRLPVLGVGTEVQENMMMAVHQLALGVCQDWAALETQAIKTGNQAILKNLSPADLATIFDKSLQTKVAKDLTAAFWYRSPTNQELTALIAALSALDSAPVALASDVRPLVLGCAAALSAVDVIRN